jgi:hypothetical protein
MSTRSAFRRARIEVLLMVAVCVVTVGLLAVPGLAGAAPATTEIQARSMNSTITWGTHTVVTGTLMDLDTITALGGLWLQVEWSHTGSPASWQKWSDVTTEGEAQYSTGQYTQVVQPRQLTYYRFVFLGTSAYAASISNTLKIQLRPYLGGPTVRRVIRAGKRFSVYGALKPRFPAGAKTVKVKVYRAKGRRWVVVKRLSAVNKNTTKYSKYVARPRLTVKGKYRFRAYTRAMDGWRPAKTTLSRVLVVK